jgi:hypothetical protein
MLYTGVSPDDVPLLWTQTPRFIQIMRSGSRFQHPHYFFDQTDKLIALLYRLAEETSTFGPCEDYLYAEQALTKLLQSSQLFSSLTREDLRQLEQDVRIFVNEVQDVDMFVAGWDERRNRMTQMNQMTHVFKRRRETCGEEMMGFQPTFNTSFATVSPWVHPWVQEASAQLILCNLPFYD